MCIIEENDLRDWKNKSFSDQDSSMMVIACFSLNSILTSQISNRFSIASPRVEVS